MKINWKLRLQNKTTLVSLVLGIIAFIYQVLTAFGVVPHIEQSVLCNIALSFIELLCLLGIVIDPTTNGISDSQRALNYTEPNKDSGDTKK